MVGMGVIYLVWTPLGTEPAERFARSYLAHPAGAVHQLTLVIKGDPDGPVGLRCRELAAELDADVLAVPADGLDLDTYARVAGQLDAEAFCFLNSASEILADDWLRSMSAALAASGVGLVGATGSHESSLSAAPRPLRPLKRRAYPGFPNPHIRTNAFMLGRELMLSLDWPDSRRKGRALRLESGAQSITRQVQAHGLQTLVVGRDGAAYPPDRWAASRTFRSGSQDNLLVADNRTREYEQAEPTRRAQLSFFAWGAAAGA